jgi:hypothetical protein
LFAIDQMTSTYLAQDPQGMIANWVIPIIMILHLLQGANPSPLETLQRRIQLKMWETSITFIWLIQSSFESWAILYVIATAGLPYLEMLKP